MLDAGNPYVLPSVLVGAAVYLGLTLATDVTLPLRVGALLVFVAVVPVVLNRLLGDRGGSGRLGDESAASGETGEESPASDEGAR